MAAAPCCEVVWFKRDLRIHDNEALWRALDAARAPGGAPLVFVYILEPGLWRQPDLSRRQYLFLKDCVDELARDLWRWVGVPLLVKVGDAEAVLERIRTMVRVRRLWSHQETWNNWTYQRDRAVRRWCRRAGVEWVEPRQIGVVRRLKKRDGWAKQWDTLMSAPQCDINPFLSDGAGGAPRAHPLLPEAVLQALCDGDRQGTPHPHTLPPPESLGVAPDGCREPQRGGRRNACWILGSFLAGRGAYYAKNVSSPLTAWDGCSRLSPHLAFGSISMREVFQNVTRAQRTLRGAKTTRSKQAARPCETERTFAAYDQERPQTAVTAPPTFKPHITHPEPPAEPVDTAVPLYTALSPLPGGTQSRRGQAPGLRDLQSFGSRLRWHCHFVQKLEDEPRIEFENMHKGYGGLRSDAAQSVDQLPAAEQARYAAWVEGRTGYPMVDACMRAVNATGWLNFRMRAMLVSFASYHLWLHWRLPALHLARMFTDYEPGIHYTQFQMQSGTTGINTVRCYNPLKQSVDQDPIGEFILYWVPELRGRFAPCTGLPAASTAPSRAAKTPRGKKAKATWKAPALGTTVHSPWAATAPPGGTRSDAEEDEDGAAALALQSLAFQERVSVGGDPYDAYPIVGEAAARKHAMGRVHGLRKKTAVKVESHRVAWKHGSRKNPERGSAFWKRVAAMGEAEAEAVDGGLVTANEEGHVPTKRAAPKVSRSAKRAKQTRTAEGQGVLSSWVVRPPAADAEDNEAEDGDAFWTQMAGREEDVLSVSDGGDSGSLFSFEADVPCPYVDVDVAEGPQAEAPHAPHDIIVLSDSDRSPRVSARADRDVIVLSDTDGEHTV